MQQRNITLTSADLLALAGTPIELVPAPGAGKILTPFAVTARLNFLTAAHTAGSQPVIKYKDAATNQEFDVLSVELVKAAATSAQSSVCGIPGTAIDAVANTVNQPLVLSVAGADFATAGGSLDLTIFYGTQILP